MPAFRNTLQHHLSDPFEMRLPIEEAYAIKHHRGQPPRSLAKLTYSDTLTAYYIMNSSYDSMKFGVRQGLGSEDVEISH